MDLRFSEREEEFRAQAREWLRGHVEPYRGLSGNTREGFSKLRDWDRELYEAGWAVVSWPRRYGGREATLWEWLIFEEEYYAAGGPQRVSQNGVLLLAPTIFEFGTQAQKDRVLPRMARGEDVWAQGWSEPDAGSDLAGLRSRATRTTGPTGDGGWLLSGQKTWSTRAPFCNWMFGLFRTDPEAERHHGLTYFLVPLDAPGVTVRPVAVLDGDEGGFGEVFLDDVFVPDDHVLGGVGQGWQVAMATASQERGLTLRSPGRFLATAARLANLARRRGGDQELRRAVADAWMAAEAYHLFTCQTVTRISEGRPMGAEASLNKLWWSEMDVRMHEVALRLLGDDRLLEGDWMRGFEFSLAGPIYAGTNEIQRNVVAERLLGLPRG